MPDCGHTQGFCRLQVAPQVVDENAALGGDAETRQRDDVNVGIRFSKPEIAGEDDRVEQVLDVVVLGAPGVRDERGPDALGVELADRVAHRVVGFDVRGQAFREALGFDVERRGEARFEDGDVDPASQTPRFELWP